MKVFIAIVLVLILTGTSFAQVGTGLKLIGAGAATTAAGIWMIKYGQSHSRTIRCSYYLPGGTINGEYFSSTCIKFDGDYRLSDSRTFSSDSRWIWGGIGTASIGAGLILGGAFKLRNGKRITLLDNGALVRFHLSKQERP
jgi:hypothetical protein